MTMSRYAALLLIALGLTAAAALRQLPPREHNVEVLSTTFTVDKLYRSMLGPSDSKDVKLMDGPPQLAWIVGYKATMVGADGQTPQAQDYMCHSNLDIADGNKHDCLFGHGLNQRVRLFTLSQGQCEVRFPSGYGVPMMTDEGMKLYMQVLNLNAGRPSAQVRHRVRITFVLDRDTHQPMHALQPNAAQTLVALDDKSLKFGTANPDQCKGPSCMLGVPAHFQRIQDRLKHNFAGHYVVTPGRHVNETVATRWLNLPYDTTVHYIGVHLHPFAESLELRDLTSGQTLFHSHARNFPDKIGLESVESYSSLQGIPLHKDHEYSVVSVYNNTSGQDQDSMAVMFMYYLDKEFHHPG